MRRLSFFFFSFLFSVSLFAQKRDYEVTLWIHQLEDSIVYVKGAYGQQNSIILDTLHLKKDGEFVLKGRFNSGIVVVASPKEDLFSFVLDKDSRFSLDIYPDGFYEVKGSLENDRYLEFQKMNMDYRLAKYEYELQMKKDPSLTDSLSALIRQKEKEFGDYRESFYRNYPENIMSVLVKAVQNPAPNMKFFDENGKLKKGSSATAEFNFSNVGKESFTIHKIDTDFPGAKAVLPDNVGAGCKGVIRITVDTSGMPEGEMLVTATLTTNSPSRPIVNLFVTGWIE